MDVERRDGRKVEDVTERVTASRPVPVPERVRPTGERSTRWVCLEVAPAPPRLLANPTWEMKKGDGHTFFTRKGVISTTTAPCPGSPIRFAANHQPESRMRETRLYGSEGGGTGRTGSPYPYQAGRWGCQTTMDSR
jgi:hypothetical protein